VQLDADYGMPQGKWLKYRERVLAAPSATKPPPETRSGKLWVCMSALDSKDGLDRARVAANIAALQRLGGRPVGFMLLHATNGGQSALQGLDLTPVDEVLTALKMMGDDDFIIFTAADDMLDPRMIRVLEDHGAFAAELALFDFYYVDDSRAYPVILHGVDRIHGMHCDYFFSRFLASAALLKQVTAGMTSASLRDVAVSCFSAASPFATAHIPVPLFCAALDRKKVAAAKAAVSRRSGSRRRATKQVSAIICTKDNDLLLRQLVVRLKGEPAIRDIVIVSNNSSAQGMFCLLEELEAAGTATVLKYDKPFNFSDQCNLAARNASGDTFLFINDDIAPVSEDWLDLLLESAAWNGGSISAPLLIYPDQTVQHGGMFLGFHNIAGHMMRHSAVPDATSNFSLCAPRKVSSLTGAVLIVPRRIFEAMNGFDTMLAHFAQDVDLCMRAARMGVDLVFDPRAVLIHFESVSVKPILADDRVRRAREREFGYFRGRWPVLMDTWLNPNVSPQDETMRSLVYP
jgi:GT2 family glycosyltransferase